MASLLWKEARERLLWAIALVLISIHATLTRGYTFYGVPGPESVGWSMGPIFIALLMGASGYASELTSRRAIFLMTRPVTWWSVLASKLVVSAAVLLAAAVTAAVTYRLACPAASATCVTASGLAHGALYAMVLTGVAYLVGLSCSSVVSGVAESAALAIIQGAVLIYLADLIGAWSEKWWRQVMQLLWPVPLLSAGILIARFGLTLSAHERLRRYAITAFTALVLFAGIVYLVPDSFIDGFVRGRLSQERVNWSISPDGRYALGRDMRMLYWLDIRRDKLTTLENVYQDYSGMRVALEDVGWMAPHTAYRIGYGSDTWFIRTYDCSAGVVSHRDIPMGKLNDRDGYPSESITSPDGRLVAVSLSTGMDRPRAVVFTDIVAGRKLRQGLTRADDTIAWWESRNVFCVTGPLGSARKIKPLL